MKRFCSFIAVIALVVLSGITGETQELRQGSPAFYLGTDRSFGSEERPYVNLEGPGNQEYSFRIYRVSNPDDFFVKSVKGRLVKQGGDEGYGNAIALFKESLGFFKNDFRTIARAELNSNTRSQARKATGVDLDERLSSYNRALPVFLTGHKLISTFSIPKGKEAWEYRRVPMPVKENGVYLIEGVSAKSVSHTVIVKSNITFVTKLSDSDTLVFIARRDSGTPVEKADVKIYKTYSDKAIASGVAEKGIFAYKGKTPAKSLIVVKKNGEYAVSDPDFYAKSFYGEGGVRAFIYTDRPVYRPGDQVFFKGIVRNFSSDEYAVTSGVGSVDVSTEKGDAVATGIKVSVSPDNGTFEGTFSVPNDDDPYLGTYNVVLSYNGKSYSTEFGVDAYKKPPFLVKVSTAKRVFIGKEKITASVSARFYYGSPVSGEQVRYRVFRKKKYDFSPVGSLPFFAEAAEYLGMGSNAASDLVADGSGKLSAQGTYELSVTPDKVDDDYTYTIIADVTTADATLSGSAAVSVNRSAFFIRALKELSVYAPGDTVKFEAKLIPFDTLLDSADKKALVEKRSVRATLYTRSFYNISQEAKREKVDSNDAITDASGTARFSFKLPKKGHYIIVLTTKDPSGAETTTETPLWASGKSDSIDVPFKNVTLKSSKDLYSVGEDAEILIMSPSADGTLFVTLEGNRIIGSEIVKLTGNTCRYRVHITPAMAPNFTVSVTQFAHDEVYKSEIKIVAPPREKFLSVKISPAKKEYKPGDTAEITIDTLNDKEKGVSAEVSVAVVDEAIYQIREDGNPNIATYFYHPRTNNVGTVFSSAYRFFGYAEEKRLKLALNAKKNSALAALKEDDSKSRERFKDTTFWSAKVKTDVQGRAVIKVPLAENITTWRVTAIAVTSDTKVGQGKTQFLSRKRLMVQAGTPRFMMHNDAQVVVANVTNLTESKMDVSVNASVEGGVFDGASAQKVTVDAGKSAPVYFTVRPSNDPSVSNAAVEFRVKGGELSDGVKTRVPLIFYGRKSVLP
ncbi:MAG TPA: MG2 domain-containing protein, partial [Spirochaetota bacterium]